MAYDPLIDWNDRLTPPGGLGGHTDPATVRCSACGAIFERWNFVDPPGTLGAPDPLPYEECPECGHPIAEAEEEGGRTP